ncbi:MAG: DsbA family protein [Candidatus Absconditabacterales bacterium]
MNHEIHTSGKKISLVQIIVIILLAINILLCVYIGFLKKDAIRLETLKSGGKENMGLIQQVYNTDNYKQQQKTAIQQFLDSIKGTTQQNVQQPTTDTTKNINQLDKTQIENIKKDTYIEGKTNAKLTIIEYSELLCPYCKKQKDNKVIETLLQKYPNDVNSVFKHYIVHPDAKRLAEAAECVGELGGTKKFIDFITKAFDLTDNSDVGVTDLAKNLGVNETKFTTCYKSDKFSAKIDATAEEGRSLFGISGTPGNVIINNENGKFIVIAGAYPIETFEQNINTLLGK